MMRNQSMWKYACLGLGLFTLLSVVCPVGYAFDTKAEVLVNADTAARDHCPVAVAVPADSPLIELAKSKTPLRAVCEKETCSVAFLPCKEGFELTFIVNGMKPWETRTYRIVEGTAFTDSAVKFEGRDGKVDITIGGKPFTTYDYTTNEKKPWPNFYPLFGPGGVGMTRNYPMAEVEGESHDHPHHQSLWNAYGNINGIDFWDLIENHGFTKPVEFNVASCPAAGRFLSRMDWVDHDGKKIFEEDRMVTIWGTPEEARMIDFDMTFKATEGDVKFGDTKEGGLVALRVAQSLNEKQPEGVQGGHIINAVGGQGMQECWGKPAPWCDYSGPVNNITAGVSIFDHPTDPFFPTRYHVRDYGLFGVNPFGLSYFEDKSKDGSRVLKNGESWHMRFRVYIHAGDVERGHVADAYENFARPPRVSIQ